MEDTMERNQIEFFMAQNLNKMPEGRTREIEDMLYEMDERTFYRVSAQDYKDPTTMLLLSIFTGGWGVDRFIMGDVGMGVLKLLTGGVCGVLWIIDIVNSNRDTREYNYRLFMNSVSA